MSTHTTPGINLGQSGHADQATALTNDQLDELIEAAQTPEQRERLVAIRSERIHLQQQIEALKSQVSSKGSKRLRAKEPTQRAINAAASFMGDPDRVAAWAEAVEDAKQSDGSIAVTGRIVQLTIGAYFAERNRDKAAATTEEIKQAAVASDEVIEAATQTVPGGILLDPSDSTTPFSRPEPGESPTEDVHPEAPQQAQSAEDILAGMSDLSAFDLTNLDDEE